MVVLEGAKDFKTQPEASHRVEKEVCRFLNEFFKDWFGECILTEGKNSDGDIYSRDKELFFEVKFDLLSEKTGNFFVEDKGLGHTKSFYYIYVDSMNYYFIRTEKLKELIETAERKYGGDNKQYLGYLLPYNQYKFHCKTYPRNWEGDEAWYQKYVLKMG